MSDWGKPGLIIVDGGKDQVKAFFKSFNKFKIPIIGLTKQFETLIIPKLGGSNLGFISLRLKPSLAKNLVTRIRDEAHRFARRYHHKLMLKNLFPQS